MLAGPADRRLGDSAPRWRAGSPAQWRRPRIWICVGPRDPATKPSRGCLRVVELSAIPQLPHKKFQGMKLLRKKRFFMGGAAESRLTQLHEGTAGLAWWRDRAVRCKSISGASATGPVSRRATSAPSHRADEPPGPQEPGRQARLVHTDRTDRSGRGARMRSPNASVLCLSPPLVALLLTRFVIRSGQSHPGLYTQPHQPDSGRRVTASPPSRDPTTRPLRRSPRHP